MFRRYVTQRLGATEFAPDERKFEDQAFATSLASFEMLAGGTKAMVTPRGDAFDFRCGYVDTNELNAFADIHNGTHIIGMHHALLVTIVEFALFVFTQADQFPEIGDANGEDSPYPNFGAAPGIFLLDKTLRGEPVVADTDRHRVPKCADRHVAAIYLAMHMVRFVWFHELAHCVNGHVLFLKSLDIDVALNEVPDPSMLVGLKKAGIAETDMRRILHALELAADRDAMRAACNVQLAGGENIEGIAALSPATRLTMCLFGAYLMTWLFDEYQRFAHSVHDLTHPFPKDRLANLVRFTRSEFADVSDELAGLHDGVCARFNRLAAKIPNMHRIDVERIDEPISNALEDWDIVPSALRFEAATTA